LLKVWGLIPLSWWIVTLPISISMLGIILAGVVVGVAKSIVAKQQAAEAVAKPTPYRKPTPPGDE